MNEIPRPAEEITLFDLRVRPIAYISMDSDTTIHMWDREPVAYLLVQNGIHHVYGFDGSHVGWFEDGVVPSRFLSIRQAICEKSLFRLREEFFSDESIWGLGMSRGL